MESTRVATNYDPLYLFIDGRWLTAKGRQGRPVENPADGAVLGDLPLATAGDLDDALAAADRAFKSWRRVSAYDRARILKRAADLMRERVEHIATQLVLEEGKTIAEARGEVLISADIFEWSAEEGRRAYGRLVPARFPGQRQLVTKVPLGPVAAFAPWNFPAITPARKIAAALAAGCSCILKPAEETPATALAIARALDDAGLPAGVLNIVFGAPEQVSAHLLASPVIRKLSFTGSTAVGRALGKLAAERVIRSTLELGGHAPVLIFEGADIEFVVAQTIQWKFRNAGQVCTAPTRFYIQKGIYSAFADKLAEATANMKVGNGLDPAMAMGPLANARRLGALGTLMGEAIGKGARCLAGNARVENAGHFIRPTILADVPDDARIMSEEPFGAVAVLNPFDTLDDAIERANRLPYGLAAYAFSQDHRVVAALGAEIEAGMIGINTYSVTVPETPFGGTKDSGFGSEGGTEGLDGYLQTRFINEM